MMHWHFDYVRLAWDSGFFFGNKKQNEKVDYSTIGLVDIEKISRDRDYATVEKHIQTIINFTLEEELSKILEPTFVKLFKLSQLSIEYLQFCKKYLDNTVILLKKELNDKQATCDNLRKDCENMNEYIGNLKKKNKDLKSHLQLVEAQNLISFDCPHCNKIFSTPAYLEAHVNRRHINAFIDQTQPTNMERESDKLQLEIKELKERLNSSEKIVQAEPSSDTVGNKNDMHNKLELHRQHVESELEAIRVANALKYEQLSETMLQKLQDSQTQKPVSEVQSIRSIEIINKASNSTNEGSTQTETNVRYVDSNMNTEAMVFETNDVNVKHEIDGIKNITEQHLQEFTKVMEEKVSTNLAHLETKLETLLTKCSSLKSTPVHQDEIHQEIGEPSLIAVRQPIAVPSKQPNEPKAAPRRQQAIIKTKSVASSTPPVRPKPRSRVLSCTENTMYPVSGEVTKESQPQITFIKNPQKVISSCSSNSGSSSSESESDSTSSYESDEVPKAVPEAFKPTVKMSNTSTLRNRSVTSLRKAIDENVTEGLSNELESILSQKLQSIGVSPDWTAIPQQSYEQAMKIINHQNKTSIKNYPDYNKYRQSILTRMKSKVKEIISKKNNVSRLVTSGSLQHMTRNPSKKHNIITQQKLTPKDQLISTAYPIPSTSKFQNGIETTAKQVPTAKLKTAMPTKKKRVLFDLDTEESSTSISSIENRPPEVQHQRPLVTATGSTTSVASSVLDESNQERIAAKEKEQKKKLDAQAKKTAIIEEDISDWDISDILAS